VQCRITITPMKVSNGDMQGAILLVEKNGDQG
jgi:hypothetical protein